ncbi:MAG: CPBP family intramembrane glutamic endopeptidase [Dokdonella sp.]
MRWLVFALLTAFIAVVLLTLAHWQLQQHLDAEARATIAAVARNQAPYRWPLRDADDVIAGRVFSSAAFHFGDDGVTATSAGGTFEIGLPIAHAIDLSRYGLLEINVQADAPFTLGLSVRESLIGEVCAAASIPIATDNHDVRIDISTFAWSCSGQAAAVPSRAAMLRLRIDAIGGNSLTLRDVRLAPLRPLRIPLSASEIPVMPAPSSADAITDAVLALPDNLSALPVVVLPLQGRDEQMLAARDRILDLVPAAVLVSTPAVALIAQGESANAMTQIGESSGASMWSWIALIGYGASLVWLCVRHPRNQRARAACEVVAVLAGPIWLIVGGRLRSGSDPLAMAIICLSMTYAALLAAQGWRYRTLRIGPLDAWIVPALTVLAGLLVVFVLHRRDAGHAPIPTHEMLRYAGWVVFQQILICLVVSDRLARIGLATRWVVLVAATAFALLHVPNAALSIVTLIGGLAWVWNWRRYRSLLPNIVAHIVCGAIVLHGLPSDWLRSAEVGARYFL